MSRITYVVPGKKHLDAMRGALTRLEMEFACADVPCEIVCSAALTTLENHRDFLEREIADALNDYRAAPLAAKFVPVEAVQLSESI